MSPSGTFTYPPNGFLHIAGPCSVESRDQIFEIARFLSEQGVHVLRGGTFKARTFNSSFQGLGEEGLDLLAAAARMWNMACITEVMNEEQLALALHKVDAVQVGARSMFNYPLLKAIGRSKLPVVLKRAMGATIEEWIAASHYIADEGNENIILCERGIRTFEPATRFTLDVAAIPIARAQTPFPVIVDPSHAAGHHSLVPPLSLAGVAAGAQGLMVELHPSPEQALSDGPQSLTFAQYKALLKQVAPLISWGEAPHEP